MTTEARKVGRPRDEQRAERRREEILDVAAKLFAERGYAETDTQVIADELGVGKGTVYRYFPSKRELFLATVDRAMIQMRDCVDEAANQATEPFAVIEIAIRTYLKFFQEHPHYAELLIQERAVFKDRQKPTYFVHRETNIVRWHEHYRQMIAAGSIREMPVEQICEVLSQLVYGAMFTNFFVPGGKCCEEQTREMLDVVFGGILSEQERQRRAKA